MHDIGIKRPPRAISPSARWRSVRFAIAGVVHLARSQPNAWLHLAATGLVVTGGWVFRVSVWEWCMLVLAMMAVWTAEGLNTAIECVCDYACAGRDERIGRAKDVAAGAVLISALGAGVIGLVVFGPRLWAW